MKKILLGILTVALVGGVAFGASRAFFSDVETSTGNTFTAGKLDLKVDDTCTYNGLLCGPTGATGVQTTWALTDLQNGVHKFFNFSDIKPGDTGENTISLHVYDNDAWACLDISPLQNNENGCTEPETFPEGTDTTCGNPGPSEGELAQGLKFFAWKDSNGNNIFEPGAGEYPLFTNIYGPASDVLSGRTYRLADSIGNIFNGPTGATGPLIGSNTYHIGLQWCAGTMSVDLGSGVIECNGSGMGNEVQSDSLTADIAFRAEQWRNNPNFVCGQQGQSGPTGSSGY